MELLFNELSIHEQFADGAGFRNGIGRIMGIRTVMARFGRELYCHRNVANAQVMRNRTMPQAAAELDRNSRRVLMSWLTRQGPFWEDVREHGESEYMECGRLGEVLVTDSAVGEAAFCCLHGRSRGLVSLVPSIWNFAPVDVAWHREDGIKRVDVRNYWDASILEADLKDCRRPLGSWVDLERTARQEMKGLLFPADSFEPLRGRPFHVGVAERLLLRLSILDEIRGCFDEEGERTAEWNRLFRKHFTGEKGWFSDSSVKEKRDFEQELTFRHPSRPEESLFCSWHGKVKTPQFRIHFSWPVVAREPVYVVYVGPKLTKR